MSLPKAPKLWKWIEAGLLLCGAACLVSLAAMKFEAYTSGQTSVGYQGAEPVGFVWAAESTPKKARTKASDVIGIVSIPQLGLSAPVTDDINPIELIRGVGHIPGTAFPGGLGTMGLAGHRDTFFRALQRVRPGMRVFVADESGKYQYEVESVRVVMPSEVEVLNIQTTPKLVLVTCYPFAFVGAAPQRFIVTAALRSVSGELQ